MKKYMLILILVIAIILILAVSFWIYKRFVFRGYDIYIPGVKTAEIKTFSEIPGFSFEYPVFKGWEVKEIKCSKTGSKTECFMTLNHLKKVSLETEPRIIITKQDYTEKDFEIPAEAVSYPNPNKVPYIYTKEGTLFEIKNYGYVGFYGSYKVWVDFQFSEKSGFPVGQFLKKVIETFKFTK